MSLAVMKLAIETESSGQFIYQRRRQLLLSGPGVPGSLAQILPRQDRPRAHASITAGSGT